MNNLNENRPGFKKTKVGWIPTEWETLQLKFLCAEKSGIKTGPFGSQLHASEYVESGIPVIMPTNMSKGRVELKNIAIVSENTVKRLKSQSCKNGDILFARRGELGRCALSLQKMMMGI